MVFSALLVGNLFDFEDISVFCFEGAKVQKKWRPSAGCLHFFEHNGLKVKSSHNNFLRLHVVAVDETQHVNARCHPCGGHAAATL